MKFFIAYKDFLKSLDLKTKIEEFKTRAEFLEAAETFRNEGFTIIACWTETN